MNGREKFTRAVEKIELLSSQPEFKAQEIGMAVAKDCGVQFRDMSIIFNFLLDMTLNTYISSRKMMAAYKSLVESDVKDIEHAIALSGYSDQQSFSKAFKSRFGITPGDAFELKDQDRIEPPASWELLSGTPISQFLVRTEGDDLKEKLTFGVPDSKYKEMVAAMELQAFYGMPLLFSNYAFELHHKIKRELGDCFRYANELFEYCVNNDKLLSEKKATPEKVLRTIGNNKTVQKVFFEREISVPIVFELIEYYGATEDELMKCDMSMLDSFPGFDMYPEPGHKPLMEFSYYLEAYDRYCQKFSDLEYFNDYIYDVAEGMTIEDALERIIEEYPVLEYDYSSDPDMKEDLSKEDDEPWGQDEDGENEDAKWLDQRIDDDPDIDNVQFDLYDRMD